MLNHHNNLPNNQVRDLIASSLNGMKVSGFFSDNETFEQYLIDQVKQAQDLLNGYRQGKALRQIADKFGWNAHDVSDHIDYDTNTYIHFVGTEDELEKVYPHA